ncbi:MAG: leucine--tRNA ligase [Candidatus Coatesbacteria bacterium]|nr:MAG: leucine--tRNA ligase [Candidatus Coatesbacteria bacterium]
MASRKYNQVEIEKKWRARWEEAGLYHTDLQSDKPKFYNLTMFVYPSGLKISVGHFYCYTGADTYGRFKRMCGFNVFQPMGYDAFGLPAENYAIKHGVHPAVSTRQNIDFIRKQLRMVGAMFDWTKEINTSSPDYYRWTQWLFLQLYKNGLAYRSEAPVNWCNSCLTVLANEQVVGGQCERCGSPVVRRNMLQWFFKITDYAERLITGLDEVDWPETTKLMQRNWIGRSEGADVVFEVDGSDVKITVFTTRPDTLFGATYMVLAPEHPEVMRLTEATRVAEVERYIKQAASKSELERVHLDKEKTGVFLGAYAINPANGEKIPIWTADYVLATYGSGAVMAVPAHDERDFEFARKFGLPIREVVLAPGKDVNQPLAEAYVGEGTMVNSAKYDGMHSEAFKKTIVAELASRGAAQFRVRYRMRDWLVSRQRYWGAPIPIVYCDRCGELAVPEKDLPVTLPQEARFEPDESGRSPLARSSEFMKAACPKCGGPALREADTMDTMVCSSWYMLRFPSAENDRAPFEPEITRRWLPVDQYTGGPEHTVGHLLYFRFITKVLHDLGYLDFDEPALRLRHQGMITLGGSKMSKSAGNIINPDDTINSHGSDVLRLALFFMGPFREGGEWSEGCLVGIPRFLHKVWNLVQKHLESRESGEKEAELDDDTLRAMHRTIKQVRRDIERFHFNTALAALMELLTTLTRSNAYTNRQAVQTFVLLLAPLAPHLAEELFEQLGHSESVFDARFPEFEESLTKPKVIIVPVQVNGKVRARLEVESDISQQEILALALSDANVKKHTAGKQLKGTRYVKGRIVSIATE